LEIDILLQRQLTLNYAVAFKGVSSNNQLNGALAVGIEEGALAI